MFIPFALIWAPVEVSTGDPAVVQFEKVIDDATNANPVGRMSNKSTSNAS
jgi:hypothetical protein